MEVRQKYVCLVYSTLVFAWLFPFQAIHWHLCSSSAHGMVKRLDAKPQGKVTSIVPLVPSDLCTEVGGLRCVTTSCLLVSFFFAIWQTSLYHIYITPPDYSTLSYYPFIYHVISCSPLLARQAELGALNRVRHRDGHVCGSFLVRGRWFVRVLYELLRIETWWYTLWSFNIAMENGPFIAGLPIKKRWFSMAVLNNQMVSGWFTWCWTMM